LKAKTGIPTMVSVARLLCRTIFALKPLIIKATNSDPAVLAALAAASAACVALEDSLRPHQEQGV